MVFLFELVGVFFTRRNLNAFRYIMGIHASNYGRAPDYVNSPPRPTACLIPIPLARQNKENTTVRGCTDPIFLLILLAASGAVGWVTYWGDANGNRLRFQNGVDR